MGGRLRAMRILIVFFLSLFSLPALAQQGEHYSNARFGFGMDIPYFFVVQGESHSQDGQQYAAKGKPINLMVWGGSVDGDFESEAEEAMTYSRDGAWNVNYQAVTPRWANFSAVQGFHMLYQRMVLLCDGKSYAAFRAEYSVTEASKMEDVIQGMVRSLKSDSCS